MSRERGALALVLHSHMPYVEGFGTWPFGEEWLWEAVATVYLPLIELLEEVRVPLTLGLTPVLCDQLETLPGPAGERLLGFLSETRRIVHTEDARGLAAAGHRELAAEVRRAGVGYERAAATLERDGRDLLPRLAALATDGPVELWTSAATHAVLPLLASDAGLRLQLATGIASHERRFGGFGGGLWLPECAYVPGLERELADHGVRATCLDQTDVHGLGAPDHLEPVLMPGGVVGVRIDWESVALVWNGETGYPAHPTYRDYHRRTVHDLRPWSNAGEPYRPAEAAALARAHARSFVERCRARLDAYAARRGRPGLLTFALDTELLGHWWYEGQTWLRAVFAEAAVQGLRLARVGEALDEIDPVEGSPEASSWGEGRGFSTWDSPRVADMAFAARTAELRTVAASAGPARSPAALERAARELLALQASDWAFQEARQLAGGYPRERVAGHAAALDAALGALVLGRPEGVPRNQECGRDARTGYSADVTVPALRNLAPDLTPAALLAP